MCGVFGAICPDPTTVKIGTVLASLRHRGPNDCGTFLDPDLGVCLAHTRLAVIDPQAGRQPLVDPQADVVLVCNGMICDFEGWRSRFQAEGYEFRSASDSEVILPLYSRRGLALTEHLRGEFTFLLLDRRRRLLVACRDRFGIKPLHLTRTNSRAWCFASEAKAIFASGMATPEIDLRNFYLEENGSLFRGVYGLPPATILVVDLESGAPSVTTYWKPDFPRQEEADDDRPLAAWREAVDRALEEAVRLRLRADVPVGVYLSGGLDSAMVAAKASRLADPAPAAFSVSFTDAPREYDEGEKARSIAAFLGLEHEVVEVDREALWTHLEASLWHNEAPLPLVSVGKFLLSARAGRRVGVVLTGEGADELFLGYERFRSALTHRNGRPPPVDGLDAARRGLGAAVARLKRGLVDWSARGGLRAPREPDLLQRLLSGHADDPSQLEGRSPIVRFQYRWLKTRLRRLILSAYGDRMEMAPSVEGRLPFLDHLLFAVARRIPVRYLIHDGLEKYILRSCAETTLPREVLHRRKWRFSVPPPAYDERERSTAAARIFDEHLSKRAVEDAGLFRWTSVRGLLGLRRLPPYRRAADRWLFAICCLQILQRQFEGGRAPTSTAPR